MIGQTVQRDYNEELRYQNDAINKMLSALDEFVIEGINTILPYHKQILNDKNFKSGHFDTSFIDHFNYIEGNINENN